jgi:transcriptional regulator with XRE-family HTH domain
MVRRIAEPDPIDVAVGARIRMRRKTLGVTQSDLAEALGLTFQQVQKYERGTNRVSASMLVRAARRLECSVGYLVGEDGALATDEPILKALTEPSALEALQAFVAIQDSSARAAALTALRAIAAAYGVHDEEGRRRARA